MPRTTDIQVLMVGGKRCGKTTVLAAMKQDGVRAFEGRMTLNATNIRMNASLNNAYTIANGYFDKKTDCPFIIPDENRTSDKDVYEFSVGLTGKRDCNISVNFIDVPGEWYNDQSPHYREAEEYLQESDVIIIAIDTPRLMENMGQMGYGNDHLVHNKPREITTGIKKSDAQAGGHRVVLFVPAKCEKYYNAGRMQEVSAAIKAGYGDLIQYLQGENLRDLITVAIMPLLSMGGLEFLDFRDQVDEKTGKIEPKERFYFTGDFEPRYCEQPLLVSLALLLTLVKKNIPDGWIIRRWRERRNKPTQKTMDQMLAWIRSKLVGRDPQNGFEVLQEPTTTCIF